jgi:DNA-binding response OmpR family regulator
VAQQLYNKNILNVLIMRKRILAVDDDPMILLVLKNLLEDEGYKVDTLSKGEKVFEKISKHMPDLILLDVVLGDLDGRNICKSIKEKMETHNIPVILVSATHNLSDSIKQEGAPDDFLSKPFDLFILLRKIKQQLAA